MSEKARYRWARRLRGRPAGFSGTVGNPIPESTEDPPEPPGLLERRISEIPICDRYVDRYLADYTRRHKPSSVRVQSSRLRRFREDFTGHSLAITATDLREWVAGEGPWSDRGPIPRSELPALTSLFNHAIKQGDVPFWISPARKLSRRPASRLDQTPPSPEEFETLLAACSVLGDAGQTMRALLLFAACTLMRPGELYVLEWADLDFASMQIRRARRTNHESLDKPEPDMRVSGLTHRARDAVKGLPRDSATVFTSMAGEPLTGETASRYWNRVLEAAEMRFSLHFATKHYGVHYMSTELGLSPREIAAQGGWPPASVVKMLRALPAPPPVVESPAE